MQPRNLPRRTKIVATVGPASIKPGVLRQLIGAGATTLRLNFSHGTSEDHQRSIRLIRQTAFELNQPVAILQDLQGPKIRLGKFESKSISLQKGDPFILTSTPVECNHEISYVSYERLAEEVPEGATILLEDGMRFQAVAGFLQGAAGSDGVRFSVRLREGRRSFRLLSRLVGPQQQVHLEADLSRWAGKTVSIVLRVDAGGTATRDLAVWVSPRLEMTP